MKEAEEIIVLQNRHPLSKPKFYYAAKPHVLKNVLLVTPV